MCQAAEAEGTPAPEAAVVAERQVAAVMEGPLRALMAVRIWCGLSRPDGGQWSTRGALPHHDNLMTTS